MPLTQAQKSDLEAAIFAYLATEGSRFARTVAALKEEAQLQGEGNGDDNHHSTVVSGTVLERTWAFVHHRLYLAASNLDVPSTPNFLNLIHADCIRSAIELGDVATVQLYEWIIGNDFKAFRGEEDGESPLYLAADNNYLGLVQHFVKGGHDMNVGNVDGTSPLHAAAWKGHAKVVRYLVEQGADKDKAGEVRREEGGETPLSTAVGRNRIAVVRILVELGADKDKHDVEGKTPLYVAAHEGHSAVVQYLVEHGADIGTHHHRCDVNLPDMHGCTPLHEAAGAGRLEVVRVLLKHGAALDLWNNRGATAVDLAARHNHHDVVRAIETERGRRYNRVIHWDEFEA
jgi:hypothetical protein